MKKMFFTAILLSSGILLASCDRFASEKEMGESIPRSEYKVYFASLLNNTEREGERIAFEGYFYIGNDVSSQDIPGLGSDLATVMVYSEPLGKGELVQVMLASFGDKKNTIFVPEEFAEEDLKVITNEGRRLDYNEKVKISGTVTYLDKKGTYNKRAEKRDYHYFLTDVRFDSAE